MVNSRLADRLGISAQGSFRRGSGLAQAVSVVDLTPLGCRLIDIPRNLARGEDLTLRIGGVGPIPATVRWVKVGREAGIEFEAPLPQVTFTVLLGQHRLTPLDPYRTELMALHNTAVASAERSPDTAEPDLPTEEKVVSIHASDLDAERRASLRIAANDPAMMLRAGADPVEVRIADFSHTGMRLGLANASIAPGAIVSIVFPDNEIIHGEVRWNNREGLGIRVLGVGEDRADAFAGPAEQAEADLEDAPGLATDTIDDMPDDASKDELEAEAIAANALTAAPDAEFVPMSAAPADPDNAPAEIGLTELDCSTEGLAALPHMPAGHLERFAALLEAAKACDFAAISIRVTAEGIEMDLAYCP